MAYGVSTPWALTPISRVADARIGSRAQFRAHDGQCSPYRIREGLPTTKERQKAAVVSVIATDISTTMSLDRKKILD